MCKIANRETTQLRRKHMDNATYVKEQQVASDAIVAFFARYYAKRM